MYTNHGRNATDQQTLLLAAWDLPCGRDCAGATSGRRRASYDGEHGSAGGFQPSRSLAWCSSRVCLSKPTGSGVLLYCSRSTSQQAFYGHCVRLRVASPVFYSNGLSSGMMRLDETRPAVFFAFFLPSHCCCARRTTSP